MVAFASADEESPNSVGQGAGQLPVGATPRNSRNRKQTASGRCFGASLRVRVKR